MELTDQEYSQLLSKIKEEIIESSQGVDELPLANSLEDIESLPALKNGEVVSVPLELLKGKNGENVSLRINNGYIQWSLGNTTWENLIAIEDLVGAAEKERQKAEISRENAEEQRRIEYNNLNLVPVSDDEIHNLFM